MRPYSLRPFGLLGGLLFPGRRRRLTPLHAPPHPLVVSRRRFWARPKDPDKDKDPPHAVPGVGKISELVRALSTQEGRPPKDADLVDAFRRLVGSGPLLDEHARGLARTYEYLRGSPRGVRIPAADVRAAVRALRAGTTPHQAGLARVLFAGLAAAADGERPAREDVLAFVGVLCGSGNTAEAVEITRRYAETLGPAGAGPAWESVLEGFAREADEETLLQTWELLESLGVAPGPGVFRSLVGFYCGRGELERAREWYARIYDAGLVPTLRTSVDVLAACVRGGRAEERAFGRGIVEGLLAGGGERGGRGVGRAEWDAALQWTTLLEPDIARGLERADRLLEQMAAQAAAQAGPPPNIDTINGLVRFAVARNDADTAGHFLRAAMKRGFEHNRATMELQLELRLLAHDVQGARAVYEELRREDIAQGYEAREAKMLLRALCRDDGPRDMDQIRLVYLDLKDWAVRLDADTLTAALSVFLERCDFQAVIELLSRDCHAYPPADRRRVIHEMGEFIGRGTTSIEAAWDSYQILYQLFPELSVRQRTDIMRLFFELERSDMATLVFHHMRGTPGRRPDRYTYSIALLGVAYSRDLDALRAVHNALKLDQFVDLDTPLVNSLMAAYNHCGVPQRALHFWEEVKKSREGPDYVSISIALDTCGSMRIGGTAKARILWGQLRAMGVKPDMNNYCSYVEALGRNGDWGDSWKVVKEMELLDGVRPDTKL